MFKCSSNGPNGNLMVKNKYLDFKCLIVFNCLQFQKNVDVLTIFEYNVHILVVIMSWIPGFSVNPDAMF